MKKVKTITLDDWEKVGEGGNAESFFNKKNDKIMLKLSKKANRNVIDINNEIKLAKLVNKIKINTPKMMEEVTYKGRKGIVYERLKDKKSIAKLCHDNPEKIEYYAKLFAKEAAKLHSIKCNLKGLPDGKKILIDGFRKASRDDKVASAEIIKFIKNEVGDLKYCVHGDLSIGNLVMSSKKLYWIDTGRFTYGDPILDMSMIYLDYKVLSKLHFVREIFHLNYKQLNLFCDTLLKEYVRINKYDYEKFIERVEKLSIIWYHKIWAFSTATKFLRDFVRYKAKKYQNYIESKHKK